MYSGISMGMKERIDQISAVARINIDLAFLLAEFNFEWVLRRTLILMAYCPSKAVRQYLLDKNGWQGFQTAWDECRKRSKILIKESFRDAVCYGNSLSNHYIFAELRRAIDNRHRLVHGGKCSIKEDDALIGMMVLIDAAQSIVDFAISHGINIYKRIGGTRKCRCDNINNCPIVAVKGRKSKTRLITVMRDGRRIYDCLEIRKKLQLD